MSKEKMTRGQFHQKIIAGCDYFFTEKLVDALQQDAWKKCFVKITIAAGYYFW